MKSKATYPFNELIERISTCTDYQELELLAQVWRDEVGYYSYYHVHLACEAFRMMSQSLLKKCA